MVITKLLPCDIRKGDVFLWEYQLSHYMYQICMYLEKKKSDRNITLSNLEQRYLSLCITLRKIMEPPIQIKSERDIYLITHCALSVPTKSLNVFPFPQLQDCFDAIEISHILWSMFTCYYSAASWLQMEHSRLSFHLDQKVFQLIVNEKHKSLQLPIGNFFKLFVFAWYL